MLVGEVPARFPHSSAVQSFSRSTLVIQRRSAVFRSFTGLPSFLNDTHYRKINHKQWGYCKPFAGLSKGFLLSRHSIIFLFFQVRVITAKMQAVKSTGGRRDFTGIPADADKVAHSRAQSPQYHSRRSRTENRMRRPSPFKMGVRRQNA